MQKTIPFDNGNYIISGATVSVSDIPAGAYEANVALNGKVWLSPTKFNADSIMPLPSRELDILRTQTAKFLAPATQDNYAKFGYVYKRGFLLYGKPGAGKTSLVTQLAMDVVERDGIVLYGDPRALLLTAMHLKDITNRLVMVIFEELDAILAEYERSLLTFLDGQSQLKRMIIAATTNFIDKIPKRILRPGRFGTVMEIGMPSAEARAYYLDHKIGDTVSKSEITKLVEKTDGFSIDEVKEVVQAVYLLDQDLDGTLERINDSRDLSVVEATYYKPSPIDEPEW